MSTSTRAASPDRSGVSRRQILLSTGAAGAWLLGWCRPAAGGEREEEAGYLERGDRIKLEGRPEEIVKRAYDLGHAYEKKYGGCARCTVAACQDAIPFVPVHTPLFRGATCLDGGATPVDVQNCGAFTGCGMIIGHLCGSTRNGNFRGDAGLAHELLHKVYHRFKEHYGTVLCRDVRKGAEGDCPKVVGRAARWVAEVLLEQFTDYKPPAEKPTET